MLYAIEWIRVQLTAAYQYISGFFEAMTLESMGSFLTWSPVLLVLYILAGLALVLIGFRSHRLISSLVSGAVMGYWGWQIGYAINAGFLASSILWMMILGTIGLFLFYFLYAINVAIGAFFISFATVRYLSAFGIGTGLIAGMVFAAVYCIVLLRRHFIRTPIAGGMLFGVIALHYFGDFVALGVFVFCVAGGIVLQNFLRKRYEKEQKQAMEYRPKAPSPPTPEEIAAEIAQEEAERAARGGVSINT